MGSDDKAEKAAALGADHVINYNEERFEGRVRRLTGKQGVDVVFEHVGPDTWPGSLISLKKGGRLVTCGSTSGIQASTNLYAVFQQQLRIFGSFGSSVQNCRDSLAKMAEGAGYRVTAVLALVGASPVTTTGQLSLTYIVVLSFADAVLVLLLIWLLLRAHGERALAILVGTRPAGREALLGVALVPAVFLLVAVTFGVILQVAPWLHNVTDNPLEALLRTPADAVWFGLVAVVAAGLREEVQRGFILHRFEQHLGGGVIGLIVFSAMFGLGHLLQGWDAVIVTGLLGAFWGTVYLRRRSIVAPILCHSIFNLIEILIAYRANAG